MAAPGGHDDVAGRPSHVIPPARKKPVARDEQRPRDSAGMLSEAHGINTNSQQANSIVGDDLPKDGARKKKYRAFIHGSTYAATSAAAAAPTATATAVAAATGAREPPRLAGAIFLCPPTRPHTRLLHS